MKISVITTSFNHGQFLEATLRSVGAQTYRNVEHVVIDGGSSDNTIEILEKYQSQYNLKWISELDNGQTHALNKGLAMISGDIVVWLNSDDVFLYKDTLEQVARVFESGETDVLMGDMAFLDKEGSIIQFFGYSKFSYQKFLSGLRSVGQPSVFIKSDILKKNKFREDLHYAFDFEFWLRILRGDIKIKCTRFVLSGSRMYPGTKSSDESKLSEEKNQIFQECNLNPRPFSRLDRKIDNFISLKVRGLWLLIKHRYFLRSPMTSDLVKYKKFPMDIIYQIFRKMRSNYEQYWSKYFPTSFWSD